MLLTLLWYEARAQSRGHFMLLFLLCLYDVVSRCCNFHFVVYVYLCLKLRLISASFLPELGYSYVFDYLNSHYFISF